MWGYTPSKLWLYVDLVWAQICRERTYTTVDTSAAIGGAFGAKLQDYLELINEQE